MSHTERSEESDDAEEIAEVNMKKLEDKAAKSGYVDGRVAGREKALQEGFDKGYSDGFRLAFMIEKYRSFYESLIKNFKPEDVPVYKELMAEKEIFDSMKITDLLKEDFIVAADQDIEKLISEKKKFVDELESKLNTQLPVTTGIFNE